MKPRNLLILAALVIGVGTFIWLFERDLPSSDERRESANLVVTLEADDIEGLVIEQSGSVVEFVRSEAEAPDGEEGTPASVGSWRLARPVSAPADDEAVGSMVRSLTALRKERTLEDVDRAEVGLSPPRASVQLTTPEEDLVLEIGGEIPASGNMTLALAGRPEVYVVPGMVWTEIRKPANEWRDKNLYPGLSAEIEKVTLSGQGGHLTLVRRDEVFWVEQPVEDRADEAHVNALLAALTGLRAEIFLDGEQADAVLAGGADRIGSIEVGTTSDQSPFRIELGGAVSGTEQAPRYARVQGEAITTLAPLVDHVLRASEDWRSRSLSDLEIFELETVEITDESGTLRLVSDGSNWLRGGEELPFEMVTGFLDLFTGGEAESLVDIEVREDAPVTLTVRFVTETGEEEVLRLQEAEGLTLVSLPGRSAVASLSADTVAEMRAQLEAIRVAEPVVPFVVPGLEPGEAPPGNG